MSSSASSRGSATVSAAINTLSSAASSVSTAAAKATTTAATVKKVKHQDEAVVWTGQMIGGVLALLFLVNVFTVVSRFTRKTVGLRRGGPAVATGPVKTHPLTRGWHAITSIKQTASNYTLPKWIYSMTANEMTWTVGYLAFGLFWGFQGCDLGTGFVNAFANQVGLIAYVQIPLIVGLASKNNVISAVTGIGYEKLNFLHRAAARTCFLNSWLHTGARLYLGLTRDKTIDREYVQWGIVGIVAFSIVTFTSIRPIRNRFYEVFLFSHIVLIFIFILSCYFHFPKYGYFIWPGFLVWGLDRFVRMVKMIFLNKLWIVLPKSRANAGLAETTIEVIDQDTCKVIVNRSLFKWSAGQHAYLTIPTVSHIQAHPFTMCGIPSSDGKVEFIIRVRDGFTRKLRDRASDSEKPVNVATYVEGPYGATRSLSHNGAILLIAGGSGITFAFAHLAQAVDEAVKGKTLVTRLHLVWMIRKRENYDWIHTQLTECIAKAPSTLSIKVDIHLTNFAPGMHNGVNVLSHDITPETPAIMSPAESISEGTSEEGSGGYMTEKHIGNAVARKEGFDDVINWHVGRGDLETALRDLQEVATGTVSVNVCGPTPLQVSARQAVSSVGTPTAMLKGAQPVEFYSETFGW